MIRKLILSLLLLSLYNYSMEQEIVVSLNRQRMIVPIKKDTTVRDIKYSLQCPRNSDFYIQLSYGRTASFNNDLTIKSLIDVYNVSEFALQTSVNTICTI